MEIAVYALAIALCLLIYLYFQAIKNLNTAINFWLLILASEPDYRVYRDTLLSQVSQVPAKNDLALAMIITGLFRKLVYRTSGKASFENLTARLWKLKTSARP